MQLEPSGSNKVRKCCGRLMVYNNLGQCVASFPAKCGELTIGEQVLIPQLVRPENVVIDAGAIIGARGVELAHLVGPLGALLAFEVQRIAFQALCANLALNRPANILAS